MNLAVIILVRNEELHLQRCLDSIKGISNDILVVDSGSADETLAIADRNGARVLKNTWVNYATQFNWALQHIKKDTDWVLRLDADEIVTPQLAGEISTSLSRLEDDVSGVYFSRSMCFLQRPIRWGGLFPIRVLRLFRNGKGRCENRWMDEHILVDGDTFEFEGEIIDDNLNSLTWWTEKHNAYASREVVDLLNLEYGFMPCETVADITSGQQASVKRWVKEKVYARLPAGFRAAAYFFYRYILRLGFLDGREGTAFHVLQGFWYRYLVDMKLHEVKAYMRRENVGVEVAIQDVLGIDVRTNR